MGKKEYQINTDEAARLLEALAQADTAHSETIEGWVGQAYLQFKDHLDRYRIETREYIDQIRRQDRRIKTK